MAFYLSTGIIAYYGGNSSKTPSASLSLRTGSRTTASVSLTVKSKAPFSSGMLLQCAFTPFFTFYLFWLFVLSTGRTAGKRSGLVVRAAKYSLCQTKRNRSRKSLARTHGFRKHMSTTRIRAVLQHRTAKGRWTLCTKTNPSNGKHI